MRANARRARTRATRSAGGGRALDWFEKARAAHARGAFREAAALYDKALRDRPDLVAAHGNLGAVLRALGRQADAAASCRRALSLDPNAVGPLVNLAAALQDLAQYDEAEQALRRALELRPRLAAAHYNLGYLEQRRGRLDEALACYDRAVLAVAGGEAGPPTDGAARERAVATATAAAARHPMARELAAGYNNLGAAFRAGGRPRAALDCFERAVALRHGYAEARWNRAIALLEEGDYERGWRDFDWRWQTAELTPSRRAFPQPAWDGGPLPGRTILLHAEQGLGDTIQFIRFVPHVKALGARVVVECQPALRRLVERCSGADHVVARGEPLPEFDVHAPLMSLGALLEVRLDALPAPRAYLSAPAGAPRADAHGPFRVGLVWGSSPENAALAFRSCPFNAFAELLECRGAEFVSLQKGPAVDELRAHPLASRVEELGSTFHDLDDTARVISSLDLVVSVDTSVAHLAAALGRPTWILLAVGADWRWLRERADSPWYPTARLFRQSEPGGWAAVVRDAAAALRAEVSRRASRRAAATTPAVA